MQQVMHSFVPAVTASVAPSRRRQWLQASLRLGLGSLAGCWQLTPASAAGLPAAAQPVLSRSQSTAFRQWFVAIVGDQVMRPSPRWVHRDCAGLVRFAVAEAFKPHDARWRHAMGWSNLQPSPPEVDLAASEASRYASWRLSDGSQGAFASALTLVQHNTRFMAKTRQLAQPGDLLFFDQGDDQHLMVWTGHAVAYHNGAAPRAGDNGLRWQRWEQLERWPDTRWRPNLNNPNFAGLFRLSFLSD